MKIGFLFILCSSLYCFAVSAQTVSLADLTTPGITASNASSGTYFSIVSDDITSQPTSEGSPLKIYIPLAGTDGQANHTIISNSALLPSISNDAGYFRVPLELANTSGSTQFLNVAVEIDDADDTFRNVALDSTVSIAASTTSDVTATIELKELCDQTDPDDCDYVSGNSGENSETVLLYFYLDSSEVAAGSETDDLPATKTNGVFVEVNISDEVPDDVSKTITLSELRKGDGQLVAVFDETGSAIDYMASDHYINISYDRKIDGGANTDTIADAKADDASSGILQEHGASTQGTIVIKNLVNDQTYFLSIAFVNKFQFASFLSNVKEGKPETIESFLKKQACYLVSAGYQDNHFVLDYFRNFRDEVLLNFDLGRRFIEFYYETAPKYAPYIYKSKILSFIVRTLSFTLYILFKYFYFFAIVFLLVLGASKWLRNRRIFSTEL